MTAGDVSLIVDAIAQLQDVVVLIAFALMYALGFLAAVKLASILPL